MSTDANGGVGCLTMLIVAIAGYSLWGTWHPKDEVTVYLYGCATENSSAHQQLSVKDCRTARDKRWQFYTFRFRVDFEGQRVTREAGLLRRFDECTVFDAENWNCRDGVHSFGIFVCFYGHSDGLSGQMSYIQHIMSTWGLVPNL